MAVAEQSDGSLLLDIYVAFLYDEVDRMFSRDLVRALSGYTDRPWVELRRGKALTETWLAQQLRPYGVRPKTIRIGKELGKGYMQEEMIETFRRYIPKPELEAFLAEQKERSVGAAKGAGSAGTKEQEPKEGKQGAGVSVLRISNARTQWRNVVLTPGPLCRRFPRLMTW